MSDYNIQDKQQGQSWSADEHNQMKVAVNSKLDKAAVTTSISSNSTHNKVPTALAVYIFVQNAVTSGGGSQSVPSWVMNITQQNIDEWNKAIECCLENLDADKDIHLNGNNFTLLDEGYIRQYNATNDRVVSNGSLEYTYNGGINLTIPFLKFSNPNDPTKSISINTNNISSVGTQTLSNGSGTIPLIETKNMILNIGNLEPFQTSELLNIDINVQASDTIIIKPHEAIRGLLIEPLVFDNILHVSVTNLSNANKELMDLNFEITIIKT